MANSREFQLHSTVKCPPKVSQNEVKLFSCLSCHEWQIKQPQKESAMIWLFHSPVSQAFTFCLLFQWIFADFFFSSSKNFYSPNNETIFLWVKKKIHWCKRKQEKSPIPEKKKAAGKRHFGNTRSALCAIALTLHINHRCFFFRFAVL